jgi:hypothetical protein
MHGADGGAPKGKRNGRYRTGLFTAEMREARRLIRTLTRVAQELEESVWSTKRALKLRRRLGSTGGLGQSIRKPKGMRWRTFDREMARVEAAESVCDAHLAHVVERLMSRGKRASWSWEGMITRLLGHYICVNVRWLICFSHAEARESTG